MEIIKAFIVGGLICTLGEVLICRTKLTPARIMVCFVGAGVLLYGLGLYEPLVNFAGAGATLPISGFGFAIAKGTAKEIAENGAIGILTGGIKATAGGIAAAVVLGLIGAFITKPDERSLK